MSRVAIDTHAHVIDPARFAYSPDAPYRPAGGEIGPVERFIDVLDAHAMSHAVVVQPTSGYRFDNRVTLAAVAAYPSRLRAVLRIDPERAASDVALLDMAGVAGVRFDLMGDGTRALEHRGNARLLAALRERDMVAVVQVERDQLADALPALRASGTRLCIDHLARPDPALGLEQRGFQALLELGRDGHAVKLSGPFRYSREAPPFRDVTPFVEAALAAFTPGRCCWGSDWPYLRVEGRVDYGPELRLLAEWIADDDARAVVLAEAPSRVFGFATR